MPKQQLKVSVRKESWSGSCLVLLDCFVISNCLFWQKLLQEEVQLSVTDLESAYAQGGSSSLISRARLAAARKAKRKENVNVIDERGALETHLTRRQATFSLARHDHISLLTFSLYFFLLWSFKVDPNCILHQDCPMIRSKVYRHRPAGRFADWQNSRMHMLILHGHKYTSTSCT